MALKKATTVKDLIPQKKVIVPSSTPLNIPGGSDLTNQSSSDELQRLLSLPKPTTISGLAPQVSSDTTMEAAPQVSSDTTMEAAPKTPNITDNSVGASTPGKTDDYASLKDFISQIKNLNPDNEQQKQSTNIGGISSMLLSLFNPGAGVASYQPIKEQRALDLAQQQKTNDLATTLATQQYTQGISSKDEQEKTKAANTQDIINKLADLGHIEEANSVYEKADENIKPYLTNLPKGINLSKPKIMEGYYDSNTMEPVAMMGDKYIGLISGNPVGNIVTDKQISLQQAKELKDQTLEQQKLTAEENRQLKALMFQQGMDFKNAMLSLNKNNKDIAIGQKEDQRAQDRLNKLSEAIDTTKAGARSALGVSQLVFDRGTRLNGIMDAINSYQAGNPDSRQMEEIAIGLNSLIQGGNQGAQKQVDALVPKTGRGRLADITEWLTNKPYGTDQKTFVERYTQTIDREHKIASNQLKAAQFRRIAAYSDLEKSIPGEYETVLRSNGIDPAEYEAWKKGGYKDLQNEVDNPKSNTTPTENKTGIKSNNFGNWKQNTDGSWTKQ